VFSKRGGSVNDKDSFWEKLAPKPIGEGGKAEICRAKRNNVECADRAMFPFTPLQVNHRQGA
jgi:hypothetical protein